MTKRGYVGAFALREPRHLLDKLRHDLRRIERNQCDSYAAFDFFVTADHILDWLHNGDRVAVRTEREESTLLQLCSHLGNAAKHFRLTSLQHKSVDDAGVQGGSFSSAYSSDFDTGIRLVVVISADVATKLSAPTTIRVLDLARRVVGYWAADPRLQPFALEPEVLVPESTGAAGQ